MENWKEIPSFPGYSVSDHGQIRNDRTDLILSLSENQQGLSMVGLVRDGKQFHRSVALLVVKAFVENTYEAFDTPINLDGNRGNNHVDNLVWRPRWFAVQYNRQFRVIGAYHINQPIRDVETGKVYPTSFLAATEHGLLEIDIVLSIANNTVVWPTHQRFHVVD